MSRTPIMISQLKPDQNVWKIAVRVVDIWTVKERNGQQHLEAILQDAKADQIQVVTRSRDLDLWNKMLQENQTYMIYNGETLLNDMPLKACDNKFKLFFNRATTITALDIPDIPPHTFHFKSLSEFLNGDFVVDQLYDIIGVVQQVVRTQGATAGKKACVNLTLADECGAEMDLTLWETYASQFMNYTAEGQLVLILTHSWCRQSSSNGKLILSNAWSGSKLLLNLEHPQVADFKSKLLDSVGSPIATQSRSLISCSQQSFDDRAFSFTKDVKSIEDMKCLTDETFCNTVGTTIRFKANPFGWYYEVCSSCNKTNQIPGSPFQCNCAEGHSNPISKYKIEVEVEEDSNTASFIFWDKECIPCVGLSAHALRQVMKKTNEDHPLIYPEHLDILLEKRFAFRVKYQPYYKQASVIKLTQDPDVIKMIEDAIAPTQASMTSSIKDDDAKGKKIVCIEENIANPPLTQTSNPTTTTSAAQNWSPEPSYNNTPSKRLSPELNEDPDSFEMLAPKQSATKTARTRSGKKNQT